MRTITYIILSVLLVLSCTENKEVEESFTITGSVNQDSLKTMSVILITQSKELSDTVLVKNNSFVINGKISEPVNAAILIGKKVYQFPLVNDEISLNIPDLNKTKVTTEYKSSNVNSNLQSYFEREASSFYDKYKELISREVESETDSIKEIVHLQQDSLSLALLNQLITKYSKTNNREGLTIIISDLKGLFGTRNHPEKIEELFDLLTKEERKGYYGKSIKSYLDQSAKIALGQKIDFEFIDINGKTSKLSEFNGKLVLLEFWATWCGPCVSLIPDFKKISESSDKIQIVSVSIDNDLDKWKNTVERLDMKWKNIHYKQTINLKDKFFISGVPYNILLSQEGEIIRKNISISDLKRIIE